MNSTSVNQMWAASFIGRAVTRSAAWQLRLDEPHFIVSVGGQSRRVELSMVDHLSVKRGLLWSEICIHLPNKPPLTLDGIPNTHATAMAMALRAAKERYDHRLHVQAQRREFDVVIKPAVSWARAFNEAWKQQLSGKGWLTQEFVSEWAGTKPTGNLKALLSEPEVQDHFRSKPEDLQVHVKLWQTDLAPFARVANECHLARTLLDHKDFFDTIEKSPLTDEQAKAVVSFDNRMLVVASAGSGKTSTMVAKAAYALRMNLVLPENILLLAFNNEAAKELQQRVRDRLAIVGLPAEKVVARTFHAFGLDVIGAATGKKPRLAPWLDQGQDMDHLTTIVDRLKDRDAGFRTNWDLFRMVLGRNLPSFGKEEPEDWDPSKKTRGFRTLQGDVVKSQGERMIADWLFYNGVAHRYETAYCVDTADATHGQYRPDFYYPDIDVYHEHWALDANGKPPDDFVGYLQGMTWKREVHRLNATTLIETTSAQLWSGEAFHLLAKELTSRGIVLDPNPDRPAAGKAPIENQALLRTFRTFLTHAKSNQLSSADLKAQLASQPANAFRYRHEVFLSLFEAIRNEWEASLASEKVIDFEDMLIQAADHLVAGRWNSPFELVMVDEFQDASRARARLTRALVGKPHRYLFAVGDDWQSINRFAGADLSVMTEFEAWFGKAATHRLERTFRCPQSICDVSSKFVLKNASQISKQVKSSTQEFAPAVRAIQVDEPQFIRGAVRHVLSQLAQDIRSGAVERSKTGKVSVYVLGRYRRDKESLPAWDDLADALEVSFLTIHGSKGLEADYVLLPRLATGSYGFPSGIVDDPVLQLAMPSPETFPMAEERRLFYVALTRARRSVTLITLRYRESPFLTELMQDFQIAPTALDGKSTDTQVCPECKQGSLVPRKGPYGIFSSCSRFPRCDFTRSSKKKSY